MSGMSGLPPFFSTRSPRVSGLSCSVSAPETALLFFATGVE